MKVIVTESKLTKVLHTYLNMTFEGFDNCQYEFAHIFCDEGICADPNAIGFFLPDGSNYLFRLVNSEHHDDDSDYPRGYGMSLNKASKITPDINNKEFDTIVMTKDLYDILYGFFGDIDIWRDPLLSIINNVYNTHATNLLYFE
jgi:hypothetical protein